MISWCMLGMRNLPAQRPLAPSLSLIHLSCAGLCARARDREISPCSKRSSCRLHPEDCGIDQHSSNTMRKVPKDSSGDIQHLPALGIIADSAETVWILPVCE